MRVLLDTQCWLWMAAAPERLSTRARALVETTDNELLLSAASAWEIAIKHALGKLALPEPPERYVPSRAAALRTSPMAIEHAHALRVAALPPHHRDPFDRLLVAQAQVEDVPILTADPVFARYDVSLIEA
jgi:PIN domain nuclease of toxin-antitoxin system